MAKKNRCPGTLLGQYVSPGLSGRRGWGTGLSRVAGCFTSRSLELCFWAILCSLSCLLLSVHAVVEHSAWRMDK